MTPKYEKKYIQKVSFTIFLHFAECSAYLLVQKHNRENEDRIGMLS